MKSHTEFIEEAREASSLPAQTKNTLSEESQSKSDLASIKRRDSLMEELE